MSAARALEELGRAYADPTTVAADLAARGVPFVLTLGSDTPRELLRLALDDAGLKASFEGKSRGSTRSDKGSSRAAGISTVRRWIENRSTPCARWGFATAERFAVFASPAVPA